MAKLLGNRDKRFSNLLSSSQPRLDTHINCKPKSLKIDAVIRTKGGTGEFSQVKSLMSNSKNGILVVTENFDHRYENLISNTTQKLGNIECTNGRAVVCANWMRNDVLNEIFEDAKRNNIENIILTVGTGTGTGAIKKAQRLEGFARNIYITFDSRDPYSLQQKIAVEASAKEKSIMKYVDIADRI